MTAIKDFPGYYVNEHGRVYSNKSGKMRELRPGVGTTGYYLVILCRDGARFTRKVHRLVAMTFIPNPNGCRVVNHLNGDKLDNRATNLEWCTQKQNMKHAREELGVDTRSMLGKFGAAHNRSRSVSQLKDGVVVATFGSMHEANRETGVDYRNIHRVVSAGRGSAGGFNWRYADV
jgi:hypothetical protein